jgi:hypothetical protein
MEMCTVQDHFDNTMMQYSLRARKKMNNDIKISDVSLLLGMAMGFLYTAKSIMRANEICPDELDEGIAKLERHINYIYYSDNK